MFRPYFATLFDREYMPQGLALIQSVFRTWHREDGPVVFVLALDRLVERTLGAMATPNVVVVPVAELEEDAAVARAKADRTRREYCWTLASVFSDFVMRMFRPPSVLYADADVYFFKPLRPAFEAVRGASVAIVPHAFPPERKSSEVNGRYCVSLVSFMNDPEGRRCLSDWASNCLAWCRYEVLSDRFGDQKYLDRWTTDYHGVVILDDPTVYLAPWNLGAHQVGSGPTVDGEPVVMFNFHEFAERDGRFRYSGYPLRHEDRAHLYEPYVDAVKESKRRIALT